MTNHQSPNSPVFSPSHAKTHPKYVNLPSDLQATWIYPTGAPDCYHRLVHYLHPYLQWLEGHLERLSQLQIGMSLLQRDIEQAVKREIRDEFGDSQPAMYSGSFTDILLEFTRGGYPNPMALQRSGLQRVGYLLEEETLYRLTWPTLDRAQETEPRRSRLIDNIKSMELVFFDQQMRPHSEWPIKNQETDNNPQNPLPKAIELTLELEKMGNIRRLFRVAEGPAVAPDNDG